MKLPGSAADVKQEQEITEEKTVMIRIQGNDFFVSPVEAISLCGIILATVESVMHK